MMVDAQQRALRDFAKYLWWKSADEAVKEERRLIAQVMNLGDWEDTRRLEVTFTRGQLEDALEYAEAGWFTPRMWHFWHYRLGLAKSEEDIPPLPKRSFRDEFQKV